MQRGLFFNPLANPVGSLTRRPRLHILSPPHPVLRTNKIFAACILMSVASMRSRTLCAIPMRHASIVSAKTRGGGMRFRIRLTVGALALAFAPTLALAQAATVTGRITAADRGPVSDVAVTIPQLGVGAVTREDGRYVITIPGARVTGQLVALTARRIGYRAMSVQITLTPGTVAQDLTLGANPLQLGEVVVTGARTTSTVERLGSVRNVVAPELIVKANEPN